jgi:hypothetical protein
LLIIIWLYDNGSVYKKTTININYIAYFYERHCESIHLDAIPEAKPDFTSKKPTLLQTEPPDP